LPVGVLSFMASICSPIARRDMPELARAMPWTKSLTVAANITEAAKKVAAMVEVLVAISQRGAKIKKKLDG
jgi:hypothetical protein